MNRKRFPPLKKGVSSEASHSISDQDKKPKKNKEKKSGEKEKKNEARKVKSLPKEPIPAVDEFVEKSSPDKVYDGFNEVEKIEPKNTETWKKKKELCRHPDIPCEEETRFVLKGGKEDNDFIHANKVTVEGAERSYIVAMAPIKKTMEDFWRMVYQARCPVIAMLGPFYYEGKEASEPFWPEKNGENRVFGRLTVTLKGTEHVKDRTSYALDVVIDGEKHSTIIHHLLFLTFFDCGSRMSILRLLGKVRCSAKRGNNSVIVLSSEGLRRACDFVLIDVVITRLFQNIPTQLVDLATEIRKQRAYAFRCGFYFLEPTRAILEYIQRKFPKKHVDASFAFMKASNAFLDQKNKKE